MSGERVSVAGRIAFEEASERLCATAGADATMLLDALTQAVAAGVTAAEVAMLAHPAAIGPMALGKIAVVLCEPGHAKTTTFKPMGKAFCETCYAKAEQVAAHLAARP